MMAVLQKKQQIFCKCNGLGCFFERFFFEILIRDHPNYIATYYHLGYLYLEMGDEEKAKSTFEKGMKIAAANNEELALRELKNAYDEFMMDY